jgi:hypothetical protein
MNLSKNTTKELQRELAALKLKRQQLDTKIAAVEAILTPEVVPAVPLVVSPAGIRPTGSPARPQNLPFKGQPLRAAIQTVMRQQPGLQPLLVTQALRDGGFDLHGKTDLHTRVYNELWRMANKPPQILTKDEKGAYWPVEEAKAG